MRQEPVIRNRAFGHRSNLSKWVKSRNRGLTRRERRGPFRTVDRAFKDFTVCVRDATRILLSSTGVETLGKRRAK